MVLGAHNEPLAAVCICTRARPKMLERCLKSVMRQRTAGLRVAIIVVDNDPAAGARATFDALFPTPSADHVYVHCRQTGIPIARNKAMDAAVALGSDYIVFIDDDEVAPSGWLQALWDAMVGSGADALQGSVVQLPAGTDLEATTLPAREVSWKTDESLATFNVIFKRKLAEAPLSLRFDESMRFSGGSDREYFLRASRRGARVVRAYGIDVLEEIAPGRETARYRCIRAFSDGCNYTTRLIKNDPFWRCLPRIALRIVDRALSGVRRLFQAALLLIAFRPRDAWRKCRAGYENLFCAVGCISPLIGVRAHPYRRIQGV